jgi:hypothetical protein
MSERRRIKSAGVCVFYTSTIDQERRKAMTIQSTTPNVGAQPWRERQLGYGLKLLIVFVFLLISMLAVTSGITLILVLVSTATVGSRLTGNFWTDFFPLLMALGVCAASVFGVVKLYPLVSAPNRFTPSYGQVSATFTGQPFEVRFIRPRFSRSFRGKGTLRFEPGQLLVEGTLEPSALFQFGVLAVVTLLPLLVFGIGLGFIPALLLAFWIGKQKLSRAVPYAEIRDFAVKGCRVSFSCAGGKPNKVTLYVSQIDGERLYRELAQRFPAALGGWVGGA